LFVSNRESNVRSFYVSFHNAREVTWDRFIQLWLESAFPDKIEGRLLQEDIIAFRAYM
jgi:hypothetical protein